MSCTSHKGRSGVALRTRQVTSAKPKSVPTLLHWTPTQARRRGVELRRRRRPGRWGSGMARGVSQALVHACLTADPGGSRSLEASHLNDPSVTTPSWTRGCRTRTGMRVRPPTVLTGMTVGVALNASPEPGHVRDGCGLLLSNSAPRCARPARRPFMAPTIRVVAPSPPPAVVPATPAPGPAPFGWLSAAGSPVAPAAECGCRGRGRGGPACAPGRPPRPGRGSPR